MRISTFQIVILVTLLTVVTTSSTGTTIEEDSQNSKSCKSFCDHCGCTGFYCGEECICECNQENGETGGTECIGTVQENAKKMKADFEILIQGPSGNQFLQDAQEFNQNQHCLHDEEEGREKRSTVVIYKPTVTDYKDEVIKLHSKIRNLEKAIVKRDLVKRTKRQYRPKWLQRDDSLFSTKFFLKTNDNKTTDSIVEKKKEPKKIPRSKKFANTLTNVDIQTNNADKRKGSAPVKRSFLGLNGLALPKIAILDDILGLEPLPECLFDVSVEFAADKFEDAIVLLREAADDLIDNISRDLQKKADCFESAFSRKLLWNKLISLPGISCLDKLFPKIRLCDLFDPLALTGKPLAKLFLAESLFGDASPLD